MHAFSLASGKVVTGMILEQDAKKIKVIENPLAKAEPIVIDREEIEGQQPSTTSIMPKGLLDRLTREEVLDLIAYLAARGDAHAPVFRGGHAHGH